LEFLMPVKAIMGEGTMNSEGEAAEQSAPEPRDDYAIMQQIGKNQAARMKQGRGEV
jgi:hypothetical protein